MPFDSDKSGKSIYAKFWDHYVQNWREGKESLGGPPEWPGDEWGSGQLVYDNLFVPAGVSDWRRAVEIGSGSGKYTLRVLAGSRAVVRAYDISPQFLEVCEARCERPIAEGKLSLRLLDGITTDQMLTDLSECGWRRTVDAVFSIDAMVHVDLQYLIVYLITAGLVLKPGGKLIMTLADVTTDANFNQMLDEISFTYPGQSNPIGTSKFEWISPDIVRSVLPRLGFAIDRLDTPYLKDLFVVASLVSPEKSDALEEFLRPRTP